MSRKIYPKLYMKIPAVCIISEESGSLSDSALFVRVIAYLPVPALTIISRNTFIIGIIFGIVCIFGSFEVVTTFIAIVSGQFGLFFSIIFFSNTILLMKLKHRKWNTKKVYRNIIIGVIVSGLLMVPLFLTQNTINDVEKSFSSMFNPIFILALAFIFFFI